MILDRRQLARRLFDTITGDGNIFEVKMLLLKYNRNLLNINLNCFEYDGQSLIHLCCLYGRLDLLKLFVEYGQCDILTLNRDGWLPLHIAIYLGHMNIVWYLLEYNKSLLR